MVLKRMSSGVRYVQLIGDFDKSFKLLNLGFLICKMMMMVVPTLVGFCADYIR